MRNLTTCICILGLSGIAAADVVMDQIGDMDGSAIDPSNILASQIFEDGFAQYNITVGDGFTGDGGNISMVEMVIGGWNGFADPTLVTAISANLYSSPDAAGADLNGDIASQTIDAADAEISADWGGTGTFLFMMNTELSSIVGDNFIGLSPHNEFGANGQTGICITTIDGGADAFQANPAGGFGFGPWQSADSNAAYRVNSGAPADPCTQPLSENCSADVNADGMVSVTDLLLIIETWGQVGDGTFRPAGDCAPLPNGDCQVNVEDVLMCISSWGADCAVYGGCCYGDGTCAVATADACAASGGSYFGDDSDCSSGSCVAGACCIGTTKCTDVTADACAGFGGTYKGDGTECATTDCTAIEPGDTCDVAIEITDGDTTFDTTNMTAGADLPTCAEDPNFGWETPVRDVWFKWTASETDNYDITTCDAGSYDTAMVVYEGDCSNQVACSGDAAADASCQTFHAALVLSATAGETYYIRVGGWQEGDYGPGTLGIAIVPPPLDGACCFPDESCLDNLDSDSCNDFGGSFAGEGSNCADGVCEAGAGDTCDTAVVAVLGANAFDTTTNTASQDDPDDSQCAGTYLDWGGSPDAWFMWTPDSDGLASFDTCDSSSYDTSMVLYEGSCDNQVACNGDGSGLSDCQSYYSYIADFNVSAGTTYYIRLGGWNAATGAGTLNISFLGGDAEAACCFADGSCSLLSQADCANAGGSWNSSGDCSTVDCSVLYVCDGDGWGPTVTTGAWTAGTSDTGSGYIRAAGVDGASGSTLTVWGLELMYDASAGWMACSGSGVATMSVVLYDADFNVIGEYNAVSANGVETGDVYADTYPLVEYTLDVPVSGAAYASVASESAGQGECWFLWMSADGTDSYVNDGTGWAPEDFGVSHCIN